MNEWFADGKLSLGVNMIGVTYYHNLIDKLLANGEKSNLAFAKLDTFYVIN